MGRRYRADRAAVKILHYIASLASSRGGPVRAVLDLTHALASRGHEVTILTGEFGDAPKACATGGPGIPLVKQIDTVYSKLPRLTPHQRRVAAAYLEGKDLVHLHGMWSMTNCQIANDSRARNIPYVVTLRGMLDDWCMEQGVLHKRLFLAAMGTNHLNRAALVHCTAAAELDQSRKWFPKGRGTVLPNLLDLTPFRAAPGPEPARTQFPGLVRTGPNGTREPVILFLSRVHRKKGVDTLIAAGALLAKRGTPCVLAIAGTGEPEYIEHCKAQATATGIADRVVWTGHVTGATKVSLYQAADLFALPTHQENFGFVFPEALASGTPVITTKGVDIWPELESSGAASIVAATPEAFADEIGAIVKDPARLNAMRARAKPWTFAEFDETALVSRYEAMYQQAIGAPVPVAGQARAAG